jgi:hypothetical protein
VYSCLFINIWQYCPLIPVQAYLFKRICPRWLSHLFCRRSNFPIFLLSCFDVLYYVLPGCPIPVSCHRCLFPAAPLWIFYIVYLSVLSSPTGMFWPFCFTILSQMHAQICNNIAIMVFTAFFFSFLSGLSALVFCLSCCPEYPATRGGHRYIKA